MIGMFTSSEPVKITITLPTNAYFMSGIRDFTLSMIRNMTHFSDQWAYRFQSVVDELCNNAIEHGSAPDKEIKVTFITYGTDSVEILVEDTGTGKNRMSATQITKLVAERTKPGYAFTEIRGRGLAKIVAAWTDELEFSDIPNAGLCVRIKKHLSEEKIQPVIPIAAPSNGTTDPTHLVLT